MKKIGIVTLNGYFNYGNRLQNYALQEVLKHLGFEVDTIINDAKITNSTSIKKAKISRMSEKSLKELLVIASNKYKNYLYRDKLNEQRADIFKEFSKKHLSEINYNISEDSVSETLAKTYDYFITGSDQVWNPSYINGSSIEFLTFAPSNKRISYAPSFGVSQIPIEYTEKYSLWLSEMAQLSVREEAGAKLIKELTGRDATVVLDPTMMLIKEKWLSISKAPSNKPTKKYLLTYFLGDISKERKKLLKDIAKRNDLEIVNLAQIKDQTPYLSGPSEFIDYINSAAVFCTDSFHGAVFSILLETPFIVFTREGKSPSMNSRIETLLKTFKLESREAGNIQTNNQIFEVDYTHTIPILEKEQEKSYNYLKQALEVK